jgi:protein-arginine kinase
MKYIQKQASPTDFETWKEQKKQRKSDLANAPKLRRLRGAFVRPFLEDLSKEEAVEILRQLKNQVKNSLKQPLTPFIQVLIRLLENFYPMSV